MDSELYRLFFEEAGDALIAISLGNEEILAVNRAFSVLTGLSREEVEGESFATLAAWIGAEDSRDRYFGQELIRTQGLHNEIVILSKDRSTHFVTARVRHVPLGSGGVALVVLQDETERHWLTRDLTTKHQSLELAYHDLQRVHSELKKTQEKVFQNSKLVAVGELAAGMSHELNQPLTGIRGFAQEIQDLLKSTHSRPSKKIVFDLAGEIIRNADKMATLLSHLRQFARQEKMKEGEGPQDSYPLSLSDLASVLQGLQSLLEPSLRKKRISLVLKSDQPDLKFWGNALALEQILINLVVNSRDAILEKRKTDPHFEGEIFIEAYEFQDSLVVDVTDNGPGVSEAIRSKIFDPFFSTKEVGQGMGLGLSISYGLAHRMSAELVLESSRPGQTRFRLLLQKRAPSGDLSEKSSVDLRRVA